MSFSTTPDLTKKRPGFFERHDVSIMFASWTLVCASIIAIIVIPSAGALRDTRVCNQAFTQFQSATNMVDLERAKFVLKQVGCSLSKRLDVQHP